MDLLTGAEPRCPSGRPRGMRPPLRCSPGATRLQKAPDVLKAPSTILVATTLVDDVSFWRAPGQPRAVLAWEQARLPRRFTPGDADFGPPSWDRMFSLAPIPGVLNARELVVEVGGA